MGGLRTALGVIAVDRAGDGEATPIVFLHGVGSNKSVWRPQLDHFGRSRPAVAFDYPGYGESDFVDDATREDFAAAVLAGMDALGIERAHICGLSLGGVIAIAMHHQAAERCASLILADTFAVHPEGQAIHDRAVAASTAMSMHELASARASLLLGSAATDEMLADVIETMGGIDAAAYRQGAAAVWLADQRERVAAIHKPTLVIVGDEDAITPPALSAELVASIDGAQLVTIARSGHLANLEQPLAFNSAIDRFLSEID